MSTPAPAPAPAGRAVFLSYASQDVTAAERLCHALRAAGIEVWFDQNELGGGDAWDNKIRRQIAECALFVPVISASTQARGEGYFRIEWRLAAQRTHAMADDTAFLMPVVIDDTRDAEARVPAEFKAVQWTRLPGGDKSEVFCVRVKALLGGPEVGRVSDPPSDDLPREKAGHRPALPPSHRVPVAAWLGALVAAATVIAFVILRPKPDAGAGPRPPSQQTSATLSAETPNQREARALVAKAWEQMNRTELYRAELEIADDLCRRATVVDPDCVDAWAAWSQVDCWHLYLLHDSSDGRRESARTKSARAVILDPKSFEARFAEVNYLVRGTPGSSSGAVPDQVESVIARLRELLAERPTEPRVWFALAILLRNARIVAESAAAFDRMATAPAFAATATSEKGWMFWQRREYAAAVRACDESIALQPFRGNLLLRIYLALAWLGDLDLARAALDRMPPSLRLEDDFVAMGARVYWWRREPAEMRRLLASIPRSWITWNPAPKAYFIGEAHRLSGDEEVTRASWVEALRETDAQLAKSPSPRLNARRARLLALNGRPEDARQVFRLARAAGLPPEGGVFTEFRDWAIFLSNGDVDEALDALEKGYEANDAWAATWSMLRYNPLLDPLREQPRFQALLARAAADPQRNPHAKAK